MLSMWRKILNPKKENKRIGIDNLSFMRNNYLELREPLADFKIIGMKRGKWSYFDKNKNPICSINGAKYQKWVKFSDVE